MGKSYDDKCYELALHFLSEVPPGETRVALASDLAQLIQDTVEKFLEVNP